MPKRAQPLSFVKYSNETAPTFVGEEGEDDVKSARPLYPGLHTPYNGEQQRACNSATRSKSLKFRPSWDCGLKLARMNSESVVIADQQAAVNMFSALVHTARQANKVGGG